MELQFPQKAEKKKKKKVWDHIFELSFFRVEKALARRKCTECKRAIEKDEWVLKFALVDRCSHKKRSNSFGERLISWFGHVKKQLCKECANNRTLVRCLYIKKYTFNEKSYEKHLSNYESQLAKL
jgi:hypothetical protein